MRIPPPLYAFFAGMLGIALATATMREPAEEASALSPEVEQAREAPPVAAVCLEPVTQAFVNLQLEAGVLSDLTLEPAASPAVADQQWDEIEARAGAMAATVAELIDPRMGLSPGQIAQLESIRPFVDALQADALAARLILDAGDPDLVALAARQDSVGRAAGAVLDFLVEGRECLAPAVTVSEAWAPAERCDTLDPEYEWAMSGPCVY